MTLLGKGVSHSEAWPTEAALEHRCHLVYLPFQCETLGGTLSGRYAEGARP